MTDRNNDMALPVNPGDGDSGWWQLGLNGLVAVIAGMSAGFWRTAGMLSRIDILETKEAASAARADKLEDALLARAGKVDDTITALADAHRVSWEKNQAQYWQLREQMATLVTTGQLHNSKEEIIAALDRRFGKE